MLTCTFLPPTWNTAFIHDSLLSPDGRIDINLSTLRIEKPDTPNYAVGDVASYSCCPAVHIGLEAIHILYENVKRDLLLASDFEGAPFGDDFKFKEDARENVGGTN